MIDLIVQKRTHDLGGGFTVGRVLPYAKRRMVGPFIFWDHLGPLELEACFPEEFDVRPHPHIGLATITYLYEGQMTHRDSLGYHQEIRPGEINWMIAGKGIVHSERLTEERKTGGVMHGIQSWIALPDEYEEIDPSFHHFADDDIPKWDCEGTHCHLIAGKFEGRVSPCPTHSPMFYVRCQMDANAKFKLDTHYSERAVYVTAGTVSIDGKTIEAGSMAVLKPGENVIVEAQGEADIMALGGEPVGERHIYWNFVSSTKERLEKAKEDWAQDRFDKVPGDIAERIPLPKD